MKELLIIGVGLYLLSQWQQSGGIPLPGIFGQAPIATPGTSVQLPGGFSVTVPGGSTYHLRDGAAVTVTPGSQTAPGGWVLGTLQNGPNAGQWIWLNTNTGQTAPYSSLQPAQNY